MKKRGKEITLDVDSSYKVRLGTVDNKNPKSIYISLCAWGEPMKETENINYNSVISNLRKQIKHNINSTIDVNDFHTDKYIVDLDMRSSGISDGKRSFMACEITLFQKNNISVTKPKMINTATDIVKNVIGSCLEKQEHFTFYKTKK
tara:strand:- start:2180 stop:2620 length:441 start_codon:yes stop_codon:yes gene_type:complete